MKLLRRHGPSVLSLFIILLFAGYVWQNAAEFRSLLDLSASLLFFAVMLNLINFFGNGLINLLLYRRLGAAVTGTEAMSLSAVNSLANLLPFAGGMLAKGVYLKRKFGLSYTRFLSATMAVFVVMVAASGAVGLATLLYLSNVLDQAIPVLLVAGFLVMLLGVTVLWLPPSLLRRGPWRVRVERFLQGWQLIRRDSRLLLAILLLQLALMAVLAGRYWTAFHLMSQPVTLTDCLLFAAGTTLTQLVTITPDGLGIREGIVGGIATLLGFDLGISVMAVAIDRLVSTAIIIALGSAASYYLARRIGDYPAMKVEVNG